MNKMKKALSLLLALLMVATLIPVGAVSVAADSAVIVDYNFDDGSNGGFERSVNENGYLVFDATTANWQNTYAYIGGFKTSTDYVVTFKAKANKETTMNFKINDNWSSDAAAETVNVTTEWQDFELTINMAAFTSTIVMFSSNSEAMDAAIYYIDNLKIVEGGADEPEIPAEVGVVPNGDFSNGAAGWTLNTSATIEDGALKIDNCNQWAEAAMTDITVAAGTEYTLSWKSKRVSGSGAFMMFLLNADSSNHPTTGTNWMNSTSAEWQEHSIQFTAAAANLKLKLSAEVNNPGVILIDDIKLTEKKEPVVEGGVVNGDFETGDITGWEKWQSTAIEAAAAHSGAYGAHIKGNGGWGGMLNQTFNVEDGKTYELSFWYKVNNNGFNMQFNGVQTSTSYASTWTQSREWTQFTKTFEVAGDTQIKINFCGGGNGVAEDAYIDDVMIRELKDPSDDGFIKNGDFETGSAAPWSIYSTSSVCAEAAHSGDYGLKMISSGDWGGTGDQTFTMVPGQKYAVNLWIKTVANGVNIQIQDGGATVVGAWVNNASEWTMKSFEFVATTEQGKINFCGGGNNIPTTVYVDDIEIVEVKDPSFDGYVTNGDFECGSLTGWDVYQQTVLFKEAAKNGTYGANLLGAGTWGAMLEQKVQNLVAGNAYTISFWAKANAVGSNWTLKQNGEALTALDGENKVSGYLSATEWTNIEVSFVAIADGEAVLNFCGAGTGEAENLYVDDIVIVATELPEPPACEHVYDNDCDADCNLCGELREIAGHEWSDATCTAPKTCAKCGATEGEALGHAYDDVCDADCNLCGATRKAPHEYNYACDTHCNNCGEKTNPRAKHNILHVEAVEATCQAPGNVEYWTCDLCGTVWEDEDLYTQTNSMSVKIFVDHDRGDIPLCQDGTCVSCGEVIAGIGCEYYPLCQAGPCVYCGEQVEPSIECQTDAESPCEDGWCVSCEREMPGQCVSDATNPCEDGVCINCGEVVKGAGHDYTAATCTKAKTCKVCGATSGTAAGHSYKKVITKATLTKDGKTENVCTKCGYKASKVTTIYKASKISLSKTSYTYNGKVQKPSVVVKDSAGKTISSSNYTVKYASGLKNAGTYKVTVTMKGNYSGTKTLTYTIKGIDVSKCKISLSKTSYTYNGKAQKPSVTVKSASGSKLTTSSYTVTYASGRKNVGTYKVTIKMKGNYTGTKTLTFKINPPKTTVKATAAKKSLKLTIGKKSTQVTGYEVQYSTSKSFKTYKSKTLTSYKKTSLTLTGLKAKTTYYVRVRTYKTVNGKKVYSGWSTIVYKKTK